VAIAPALKTPAALPGALRYRVKDDKRKVVPLR